MTDSIKIETEKDTEIGQTVPSTNLLNDSIDDYLYLKKPFYKYGFLNKLHFCIFVITVASTNNGYDGSMVNGLQMIENWRDAMGNPAGHVLGALANGLVFGALLAAVCAAWMSDRFGRKPSIIVGMIIVIIGSIMQGAANGYALFTFARIVIGFGANVASVSSPALISEISFPTYRETCTSLFNTFWYLGAVIAAWVTYGSHTLSTSYAWRIPSYLQGALPLFLICCIWWVPESPRFLISKGKVEEARKILREFHTGNDPSHEATRLVEFEVQEIIAALEIQKVYAHAKYSDFLNIASYRKRLFLVIFTAVITQLSGNGLVSYYLNKVLNTIGITDEDTQLKINGGLMIYNLVVSWAAAFSIQYFKRRTIFLVCTGGMLASFIIWTALSARFAITGFENNTLANGVLAFIFLFYLSYNIGANGLPFTYVTEILPYSHRAKGTNIFMAAAYAFLIYNGFVNPIAMDAIEWKYYIVYCCFLAVEVVVVALFYVETSGYTLEEVSIAFGEGSANAESLVPLKNNSSDNDSSPNGYP
ncbi:uncharacterized protein J8A68_004386 [[Candida] subhashii]|uniref:Major facilitator superfamily (MFS) profile domain-containing protein n=1 Tax=[Candida] subhashii TaxID=561895 RepID=A0A8J5QHH9_9ASCO|nr:uncharacterized protein J8A68_004386 [[Candida] subhashii]KAG7662124.1 hypothetical protein J8A68_004386 [[Candida] subhashii]